MISSGYRIEVGADLSKVNLSGVNLHGVDLHEADLHEANLHKANLHKANLRGAILYEANLHEANLYEAILYEANLRGATLYEANLYKANLYKANLYKANPKYANLQYANLQGANLQGANLQGANLQEANLQGADIQGVKLPAFQIVPEVGSFVAYKVFSGGVIGEVAVPAHAERNSSLVGRKCRVSQAVLTRLLNSDQTTVRSWNKKVVYDVGTTMIPDMYDPDIRVECTNGIHIFITKQEAEQWLM